MDAKDPSVLLGAMRAHEQGRLSLSEVLCRARVAQGAGDASTWNQIGKVALDARRPDVAARAFRKAIEVDPYFKAAKRNLAKCEVQALPARADGERYLVIRSWGHGFWSDVDHVLGQLLVAEISERTPVVHWGEESLFSDDPRMDAWRTFFEPVSSVELEQVKGAVYPVQWTEATLAEGRDAMRWPPEQRVGFVEMLSRDEPVCVSNLHMGVVSVLPWVPEGHELHGADAMTAYRWLAPKYLKPRQELVARIEKAAGELLLPGGTLALHIRGSDKITENPSLNEEINRLVDLADTRLRASPDWRLFLLTDWEPAKELLVQMHPGRVFFTASRRTREGTGLHYQKSTSRRELGEEVLIDAFLAAKCEEFLGVATSSVSFAVNFLKTWGAGKSVLVGECYQLGPNAFVHLAPARV